MHRSFLFILTIILCCMQTAIARTVSIIPIGEIILDTENQIPLIQARIAGRDTLLVLDTGAHPIILMGYFAEKIGLKTDVSSTPELFQFFQQQSIPLQFESLTGTLSDFSVMQNHDPYFKEHGIGGIYNPHFLQCKHCLAVLDFINMKMYMAQAENDDEVPTALDDHYPGIKRITAPYVAEESAILYISGVSPNHQPPATVLLDTGANATSFTRSSIGSHVKIARPSHTVDARGKIRHTETTAPISIAINGTEIAKTPVWVEDTLQGVKGGNWEPITRQGEIGMDVLKNCVVAIEYHKAVHFYCKTPTPVASRAGTDQI